MSEEKAHAVLSPSSAECWLNCVVAPAVSYDLPDETSVYAEEGTRAHALAEEILKAELHTVVPLDLEALAADPMRSHCYLYVDQILQFKREYEATGATVDVFVEQRLSIEHMTGEPGAKGTTDCVIIATWPGGNDLIHVADFKYGYREVSAKNNPQVMMYGHAALTEYSYLGDFTDVRVTIHQPRVNDTFSDFEIAVEDLEKWVRERVQPAAKKALWWIANRNTIKFPLSEFNPSESTCKWCKAGNAGMCAAKDNYAASILEDEFEVEKEDPDYKIPSSLSDLGRMFERLGFIEDWMKGVRARVESELFKGNEVPGCKLVAGKKGHRKWTSDTEVEELLKGLRVKREDMYNLKLISPTDAEKFFKPFQARWKRIEQYVTQAPGQPSVALASDKRPALVIEPIENTFDLE